MGDRDAVVKMGDQNMIKRCSRRSELLIPSLMLDTGTVLKDYPYQNE
jgi:hypothetical protein